jgi:hypothetical protein
MGKAEMVVSTQQTPLLCKEKNTKQIQLIGS